MGRQQQLEVNIKIIIVTKTATGRRSLRKDEEWWLKAATGRRLCTKVNISKNSKQQPKTRN
jgi:hypothetical protein